MNMLKLLHASIPRIAISSVIAIGTIMGAASISRSGTFGPFNSLDECKAMMQARRNALAQQGIISQYSCYPVPTTRNRGNSRKKESLKTPIQTSATSQLRRRIRIKLSSRPFAHNVTFNRNIIEQMYRGRWANGQWISSDKYPGGLAGAIRRQLSKGELVGGVDHLQKGLDRLKQLKVILIRGKIGTEVLEASDMNTARALHDDLLSALQTKPNYR
jgi:hypothetical protein